MADEKLDTSNVNGGKDPKKDSKKEQRDGFAAGAHYFVEVFVITLCVVLFLTVFLMRHTVVDGTSMQNTLQDGQHLLISDLFYDPERGDIVVLQSPDIDSLKTPIVKRIIAVGGDRVKMENGVVYLNDVPVEEDYVSPCTLHGNGADFEEVTVSEGHVFVLGDHRDNSMDSRVFGELDARCILGKVYIRIYPFGEIGFPD